MRKIGGKRGNGKRWDCGFLSLYIREASWLGGYMRCFGPIGEGLVGTR